MINVFVLCGKLRSTIGWLYNLWLGCILISIRNRSRNIYKSIIMISDYCNRFQHNRSPSWAPQCQRWRWRWRRQIKQSPMQFAYAHKHTPEWTQAWRQYLCHTCRKIFCYYHMIFTFSHLPEECESFHLSMFVLVKYLKHYLHFFVLLSLMG